MVKTLNSKHWRVERERERESKDEEAEELIKVGHGHRQIELLLSSPKMIGTRKINPAKQA